MKHELIGPPVDAPVLPEGYVYDISLHTYSDYMGDGKKYWKAIIKERLESRWRWGSTYYVHVAQGQSDLFDKENLINPIFLRQACEKAFGDFETKELVKSITNKYTGIQSGQ